MKSILLTLLAFCLVSSDFGQEPRVVRILQFYFKKEGAINAVESWIDLNEGGRILQKFYNATARTNPGNLSLDHFELFQIEEYIGELGRVWHPSLGEEPGVLRKIGGRHTVEDLLRRLCLLEAYLGPVIRSAEGRTNQTWDQESLMQMKRMVERAGKEGGEGKWTDRLGFTFALKYTAGGKIEWMKHFQDGKVVLAAEVSESEGFPPIVGSQ